MTAALTIYRTSVGKKFVMAITGIIGYGFVIGHMIGNLKVFLGATAFNEYAEFLRTVGEPLLPARTLLWIIRIVLLAAVTLHVYSAIMLTRQAQVSRPVRYASQKKIQATFASLTLRWGGVAIFLFLIYHLLHFTFGVVHPDFRLESGASGLTHPDAYHNVVTGFTNPLVVIVYLLALAALAMHMFHGVWSMFQTLGLNGQTTDKFFRGLAIASAVVLFLGFSSVPISVLAGFVK
ncbi:MAG: succinate dehydrogenase cytochrome b subunit [Roseiflexaceae bacterium]|nr:succinate dehydrogenase cytochrome b subunit [Roseiflexaceae bacterium]